MLRPGIHTKYRYLKRLRRLLMIIACLLPATITTHAAPPKWEQAKSEHSEAKSVVKDADTEIKVAKGLIIVSSSRPVQVKVYTILGQLVSRETIPAGTYQLPIQAHGVYIVKTSELTSKVAL